MIKIIIMCALSLSFMTMNAQKNTSPNIIYILADDLGYGDLSCLNENSKIKTPHIDALAQQGIKFTDAHSSSAVCSPTRYGILTGRYAWRSRLKSGVLWSYDKALIEPNRMTVASLLKSKGYQTACIGKWHLGLDWEMNSNGAVDFFKPIKNGPTVNGFDYFYGITASLDIPPYFYIHNDRITATKINTSEGATGKGFWREGPIGNDFKHEEVLATLTDKALAYIAEKSNNPSPYFLYFPLPSPHTPILPSKDFMGKSETNAYGDFVLMVDDVVGKIMAAVKASTTEKNTLIIFTSDNGCAPHADFNELSSFGHNPSYHFRGTKADVFEGGHRIPFIAKWPGIIESNTVSDETICLNDLIATCAAIVKEKMPENAGEDSFSLLPIFQKKETNYLRKTTVHHSSEGYFSIRKGKWKLVLGPGSGGWSWPTPGKEEQGLPIVQLYDLEKDVSETKNLQQDNPAVVKELKKILIEHIKNGRSTKGSLQKNDGEFQKDRMIWLEN